MGETTRYVINKATCRVILTAPPAAKTLDPMGPVPTDAPVPLGHATSMSQVDTGR